MKELSAILRHLVTAADSAGVLATLVSVAGSSYRRPGARLLLMADGRHLGSISGGCLEEDVLARARRVMTTGEAEVVVYDTTSENDLIWGVGLGCHGVVQVLLEKLPRRPKWAEIALARLTEGEPVALDVVWRSATKSGLGTRLHVAPTTKKNEGVFINLIRPAVRLAIFGAGDDAQPLFRMAKELGWHVTVADPRREWVTDDRFPGADLLVGGSASELVPRASLSQESVCVVMTHHYVHDLPLVKDLLLNSKSYIGLLGPKKRAEKIVADLIREGCAPTDEQLSRLHAPVGFDLGAETPQEIALSILAEIQAHLTRRDGRSLRERMLPIHL